jgi:hypothetical protein
MQAASERGDGCGRERSRSERDQPAGGGRPGAPQHVPAAERSVVEAASGIVKPVAHG